MGVWRGKHLSPGPPARRRDGAGCRYEAGGYGRPEEVARALEYQPKDHLLITSSYPMQPESFLFLLCKKGHSCRKNI